MESSTQRTSSSILIAVVVISLLLMLVDSRTAHLQAVRSVLSHFTQPLIAVATLPSLAGRWVATEMRSEESFSDAYNQLEKENLLLRARLQKLEALESENSRLHGLLSAKGSAGENALLAELVEVSLEPFTHRITTNRGLNAGVYVGQAAIDTNGIMGQVTGVTPYSSVVTLITDPNHAIPVQVRRNGLRAILYGLGLADHLSLPYLPPQADVKEGDVLVTSGMGGRFPPSYPVATVTKVVADANEPFLEVSAAPKARLDYAKQVLLIWPADDVAENAATADGTPAADAPADASATAETAAPDDAEGAERAD